MDTNEKTPAPAETVAPLPIAEKADGELTDDDLDGVSGGLQNLNNLQQAKHDTEKAVVSNFRV